MYDLRKPTMTREAWLLAAVEEMRPWFKAAGSPLPSRVQVSVGFPMGSRKAIGQCWHGDASEDKLHHLFISPKLAKPLARYGVLDTLAHELAHSALPKGTGHKAKFLTLCKAIGLTGKATSTYATAEFIEKCRPIARKLGDYPHGALNDKDLDKKKQGTRMIKCECGDCGYIARTVRKWIEQVGAPLCPCNSGPMATDIDEEGE